MSQCGYVHNCIGLTRLAKFKAKPSIERAIVNYGEREAEVLTKKLDKPFRA